MNKSKTLHIVTGMPAAGKTTFARAIAKKLSACFIDIDVATEKLVQAAMKKLTGDEDDRDSPVFKDTFRDPIYATLLSLAAANLPYNHVVITGPFTREHANPNWLEELNAAFEIQYTIKCIYLHCSIELQKQRMEKRANPRDRAKLESWTEYLNYYKADKPPAYPHYSFDTGRSDLEDAIATVVGG